MKFLWLTWKDYTHPEAGGAEVILRELSRRLVADGHEVTFLTVQHKGSARRDTLDGIEVIRVGANRYLHSFQALAYYLRRMRNRYDVVVEVVNTAPYFGVFFGKHSKRFVLCHQLAREIWFFETKAPLNHFGHKVLEPAATWLMSRARVPMLTVSESTQKDLERYGWHPDRMHIISEGIELEPLPDLEGIKKYDRPTILSLGAMRGMKRTLDQIRAFEAAKENIPELQMKIAGSASSPYGTQVLKAIEDSPYKDDIQYLGRVSQEEKLELMRRAHVITVTSVKEGWGLIVTEANSQGTPAVAYDVDGLRDSIRHNQTGLLTSQSPAALARALVELLTSPEQYNDLRHKAWEWSKAITFAQCYQDFKLAVGVA
jgi:glycosyltransferase involved in cell wall biosynthesis